MYKYALLLCTGIFLLATGVSAKTVWAESIVSVLESTFPGSEADYAFTLYTPDAKGNNTLPVEYGLHFSASIKGIHGTFMVNGKATDKATVAPGKRLPVILKLDVPETASPGTYDIQAVISLVHGERISIPCSLTIKPAFLLKITSTTPSVSVVNGRGIQLPITVQNSGKGEQEHIKLEMNLPGGWNCSITPASVPRLAAGDSVKFTARIAVPSMQSASNKSISYRAVSSNSKSLQASTLVQVRQNLKILLGLLGIILITITILLFIYQKKGRR